MADGMPVVLVTGAPGVGKTALAKEMGEQLWRAEMPHVVVDLDELARVRFAMRDDEGPRRLIVRNLGAMWPNYRDIGVERVVLAGIVQSAAAVEAYRAAIPDAQMTIVRLEAPVETLHDRLRQREPGTIRSFLPDLAPKLDETIAGSARRTSSLEPPGPVDR